MVALGLHLTDNDSLFCLQAARIARLEKLALEKNVSSTPFIPWQEEGNYEGRGIYI